MQNDRDGVFQNSKRQKCVYACVYAQFLVCNLIHAFYVCLLCRGLSFLRRKQVNGEPKGTMLLADFEEFRREGMISLWRLRRTSSLHSTVIEALKESACFSQEIPRPIRRYAVH